MTSPVLDKIHKLLARAAHESTPVEEARTSAVIAAKLIVEHKVELRVPGDGIWTPEALDESIQDFFKDLWRPMGRQRRSQPPPDAERRQIYHCLCPDMLMLSCACCGATVRPGTKICWIGDSELLNDETVAKVTHDSCMRHWGARQCAACNRPTNTKKAVREQLTNQRRDPPGTLYSERGGFCHCCRGGYDTGDKIVQRLLVCVHIKCYPHFTRSPCPKCGGGVF